MSVVIRPGQVVVQDPSDSKVYGFDWDTENLPVGVTITSSSFTILAIRPSGDTGLTKDSESVLAGSRSTQLRLIGGTLGALYEIANKITTSESPTQTKEYSFRVKIEDQ